MTDPVDVVNEPLARAGKSDDGGTPVVMDDLQSDDALLNHRNKTWRHTHRPPDADEAALTGRRAGPPRGERPFNRVAHTEMIQDLIFSAWPACSA